MGLYCYERCQLAWRKGVEKYAVAEAVKAFDGCMGGSSGMAEMLDAFRYDFSPYQLPASRGTPSSADETSAVLPESLSVSSQSHYDRTINQNPLSPSLVLI